MANLKGVFLSESPHWRTPARVIQKLEDEFGPMYDPCPLSEAPTRDGLKEDWPTDQPIYINPPYGPAILGWMKRAISHATKTKQPVIMLLPARTDVVWFQELALPCHKEIRFIRGRLRFGTRKGRDRPTCSKKKTVPELCRCQAPFPSMLVIF